jgi:hypothetical protein
MTAAHKQADPTHGSPTEILRAATRLMPATARCTVIAERGIGGTKDMMRFLSAVIEDVLANRIEAKDARRLNAAADKVVRIFEQKMKEATQSSTKMQ